MANDFTFKHWFHHFFNPHCEQCFMEREAELAHQEEKAHCKTCEVLKQQLEIANIEKRMLLDKIAGSNKVEETEPGIPEPIRPHYVPFRMRAAALEAESRQKARLLREKEKEIKETRAAITVPIGTNPNQSTEDLEKELDLVSSEREAAVASE